MLMRNAAVFVFAVVVIVIAGHCLVFACCAIQASAWVMTDEQLVHCDQDKPNVVVSLCLSVCLSVCHHHQLEGMRIIITIIIVIIKIEHDSRVLERKLILFIINPPGPFFKLITFSCKLLFFFFGLVLALWSVCGTRALDPSHVYTHTRWGIPFFFSFSFFLKSLVYSSPLALKQFFMFVHMSTILILILVVVFLHC